MPPSYDTNRLPHPPQNFTSIPRIQQALPPPSAIPPPPPLRHVAPPTQPQYTYPPPPPGPPPTGPPPQQNVHRSILPSWQRAPNYISHPLSASAQQAPYSPVAYHDFHAASAASSMMAQPRSPQEEKPVMLARYTPNGESFGAGVGIPPLTPHTGYTPMRTQNQTNMQEGVSRIQMLLGGNSGTESSGPGPMQDRVASPPTSAPNNDLTATGQSVEQHLGLTPKTDLPALSPVVATRPSDLNTTSTSDSPHDAASQWPMNRVTSWLAKNDYSVAYQEAFKKLDLHGSRFLDIGRGRDFFYNTVIPAVKELSPAPQNDMEYEHERAERQRLLKLMRALVDNRGISTTSNLKARRRESAQLLSMTTDPSDSHLTTPSTADGGEASPIIRTAGGTPASPSAVKALARTSLNWSNNVTQHDEVFESGQNSSQNRLGHLRTTSRDLATLSKNGSENNSSKGHSPSESRETLGSGQTLAPGRLERNKHSSDNNTPQLSPGPHQHQLSYPGLSSSTLR